jgi:hypothetical protein
VVPIATSRAISAYQPRRRFAAQITITGRAGWNIARCRGNGTVAGFLFALLGAVYFVGHEISRVMSLKAISIAAKTSAPSVK